MDVGALLRLASGPTWLCDERGAVLDANGAATQDLEPDAWRARSLVDLTPDLAGEQLDSMLAEAAANGHAEQSTDRAQWVVVATTVEDSGRFVVSRRVAMAASSDAEDRARLKAILDQEPECVKLVDRRARLLEMNPAGLAMIAADSLEQVRLADLLEIVAPAHHDAFVNGLEAVFRGEKILQTFEIVALDGTRRWMEQHAAPLWDPDQPGVVKSMLAVTRDVTERKANQERLLRKQRLESIGTLAGGIAHDLNNVLAPILLMLGELEGLVTEDEPLIPLMRRNVEDAAEMLKQLLAYARGPGGRREPVSLASLQAELEPMLRATFPTTVELEWPAPAADLVVRANATQLKQVLLNLCVNARDAMPEGGALQLDLRPHALTAAQAQELDGVDVGAPFVACVVEDHGAGMSAEVRERMFEPFYTTKGPDAGSGLGLATALGIVRAHGGLFEVHSEPGEGTTVLVLLPRVSAGEAREARDVPSDVPAAAPFEGTVLLVEDDSLVRGVLTRQLSRIDGVTVVTESSARTALRRLEQPDPIDLVISDRNMPGMDGVALLTAIRERGSDVRFVLMSGNVDDAAIEAVERLGRAACIAKPFDLHQLYRAVEAIDPSMRREPS